MGRGDAEQGAEGGMPGAAAVEAEDEFVEVALDVFAAQAVIDTERPAFEIGEDAVGPTGSCSLFVLTHRPDATAATFRIPGRRGITFIKIDLHQCRLMSSE